MTVTVTELKEEVHQAKVKDSSNLVPTRFIDILFDLRRRGNGTPQTQ
jgi:hypothetical protein